MKKKFLSFMLAVALVCSTQAFSTMPCVNAAETAGVGTAYYISSRNGDNGNSGTSEGEAWETLDKLENVTLGPGDSVLLESGSIFNGFIHLQNVGGTQENPISISSYGEGNKPVINCNGEGIWYQDYGKAMDNSGHRSSGYVSSAILLYDVDYVEISNLEITNKSNDFDYFSTNVNKASGRMDRTGVAGIAKDGGTMEHIYLDDLFIHDISGNLQDKHMNNGGIQMNVLKPADENATGIARYQDVKISNCYVKDVSRAGIVVGYTYQHDKFNGAALADEIVKKYGHTNLVLEGNYVQNAGNDAIVAMYAYQPVIQNNVSDTAGVDLDDGYPGYWQSFCAAIWPWKCKDAVFQYNEAFDTVGEGNGDGQAWDIDWSDGTVYQYNYSHNNGGGAMLICLNEAYNGTFRYNLSQNDLKCLITFQGNPLAKIYNNVFYVGGDLETAVHHPAAGKRSGAGYLANNIFYNVSTNKNVSDDGWNPGNNKSFKNNLYYGYSDEGMPGLPEADAITADPKFENPGSAPVTVNEGGKIHDRSAFEGYKIADNSPAVNAGVYIPNNATEDFFGNKLTGIVPDIGIHETGVEESVSLNVYSDRYLIQEQDIRNVPQGTTAEDFLKNIKASAKAECKVMKGSQQVAPDTAVTEEMVLKVVNKANEQETKTYNIHVVKVYAEYAPDGMTASAGSFQPDNTTEGNPAYVLDNNMNTIWHTAWSGCDRSEAWIQIDMGKEQSVGRLKYVPRKSGGVNGIITEYEVSVSTNGTDWTKAATGSWDNNSEIKYAEFPSVSARYVKLWAKDSKSQEAGKVFASAAEIRLGYEE